MLSALLELSKLLHSYLWSKIYGETEAGSGGAESGEDSVADGETVGSGDGETEIGSVDRETAGSGNDQIEAGTVIAKVEANSGDAETTLKYARSWGEQTGISGGADIEPDPFLLPDETFIKILLYLPWRQQMLCRRINTRWRAIANSALSESTKIIDFDHPIFRKMKLSDFEHLLPIVSNRLESLFLRREHLPSYMFLDVLTSISSFPSLRKIDFGRRTLEFSQFFLFLDKCPNLKSLTAAVPLKPEHITFSPGSYGLEKLDLLPLVKTTNSAMMAITEYFPRLSWLHIPDYRYVTNTCLSNALNLYAETLIHLEIRDHYVELRGGHAYLRGPPRVGFTGIGACQNLVYLSLARTSIVSDDFLLALSIGCINLETLDLQMAQYFTNQGLATLASLQKLKKLDISSLEVGFSAGVTAIVLEGKFFF